MAALPGPHAPLAAQPLGGQRQGPPALPPGPLTARDPLGHRSATQWPPDTRLRGSSWGTGAVLARQQTGSVVPNPGLEQKAWWEGVGRAQAACSGLSLEAASLPPPGSSPDVLTQSPSNDCACNLLSFPPWASPPSAQDPESLQDPQQSPTSLPGAHSSLKQGTGADRCRGLRKSLVAASHTPIAYRDWAHAHTHTHTHTRTLGDAAGNGTFGLRAADPDLSLEPQEVPISQRKGFPRWDQEPPPRGPHVPHPPCLP